MRIRFIGACREVTGSMHLLEAGGRKILLDCGMRQGRASPREREDVKFLFNPRDIDYVILSHAHIDHSGLLPVLVREGFSGKIVATEPTRELTKLLLMDSAKIMMEESEEEGRPALYDIEDVRESVGDDRIWEIAGYEDVVELDGIKIKLYDAGHILGSSITIVYAEGRTVCYTGDVGHGRSPIMNSPRIPDEDIEYLIMESTYGNRLHEEYQSGVERLEAIVRKTVEEGGRVLIPVFAVGRSQELLYIFKRLYDEGFLPDVNVYFDTPMGLKATEIYTKYSEFMREEFRRYLYEEGSPFRFKRLIEVRSHKKSLEIAGDEEPAVILATSGMLEGGRTINYIENILSDGRSSIVFVGYQAEGTLGRRVLNARRGESIEYNGKTLNVNCRVESIESFSAHADRDGLLSFVDGLRYYPKEVFIVHGERDASESLSSLLRERRVRCVVPELGYTFGIMRMEKGIKIGIEPKFWRLRGIDADIALIQGWIVRRGFEEEVVPYEEGLRMIEESRMALERYEESGRKGKRIEISDEERRMMFEEVKSYIGLRDESGQNIVSKTFISRLVELRTEGEMSSVLRKRIERMRNHGRNKSAEFAEILLSMLEKYGYAEAYRTLKRLRDEYL